MRSIVGMRSGGGHKQRKLIGAHRVWLLERTKTDFTLRGLCAELAALSAEEGGIKVDYPTVWSFAHDEGLSFKKSVLPAEQLRPQLARRREQWKKYQGRIDPRRLVFIDESRLHAHDPGDQGTGGGEDQYGSLARLVSQRQTASCQGALWPLENDGSVLPDAPHRLRSSLLAALRCDRIDARSALG